MGIKLLWTGLTVGLAGSKLIPGFPMELVGSIIMFIGVVLLWLDK